MIDKIVFRKKNTDIIANLNEAVNHITEQEEIINLLREKIEGEKEVLMKEIKEDYKRLEEIKESYRKYFNLAPFHLTKEELIDLNNFRNKHQSAREEYDEEGFRYCSHVNDYQSQITFHYIPSRYSHKVIVECPHCHTKRELETGIDELAERKCQFVMNSRDCGLVENIWYSVKLRDDYDFRRNYPPIRVEGTFHFNGKLIFHIDNKLVFNLKDDRGSVVLPFDFIKWMVPLYKKEETEKRAVRDWLDDL